MALRADPKRLSLRREECWSGAVEAERTRSDREVCPVRDSNPPHRIKRLTLARRSPRILTISCGECASRRLVRADCYRICYRHPSSCTSSRGRDRPVAILRRGVDGIRRYWSRASRASPAWLRRRARWPSRHRAGAARSGGDGRSSPTATGLWRHIRSRSWARA